MPDAPLRKTIARALEWQDAHAGFESAVEGLAPDLRGRTPEGVPYSPWQLVEHIRITQADILEFCQAKNYKEKDWPKDYWPPSAEPPSKKAWDESVAAVTRDRATLAALTLAAKIDLDARVPNGDGQTYLREVLLVLDHTAYHVGELIVVRRLLGAWKK